MEKISTHLSSLIAPVSDPDGNILVISADSLLKLEQEEGFAPFLKKYADAGIVSTHITFDPTEQFMYICDQGCSAILTARKDGSELTEFVKEYEGKPFKGPNSATVGRDGAVYFTDSGPLGETSIQRPRGSVYTITADTRLLQPLAYECLAHPSGIALSPSQNVVYVAETLQNRILRFVAGRPKGVFHFSVFKTFAGGLGPTALAVDAKGLLYVARQDLASVEGAQGFVTVLDSNGNVVKDLVCPAPEVNGLGFDRSGTVLYITEATTKSLYRLQV